MVAIFPNVFLWGRSYSQNWEVLTLENMVWPSFLFYCFVKIWATCENFFGKWFTAPPGKKLPVRLCIREIKISVFAGILKRDFSANQRFCYWNQQKSTMRNLVSKVSHWKMLTSLTSHLYFHVLLRSSCKAIMPKATEHLVERVAAYSCCWCQAEFNQSVWMYSF